MSAKKRKNDANSTTPKDHMATMFSSSKKMNRCASMHAHISDIQKQKLRSELYEKSSSSGRSLFKAETSSGRRVIANASFHKPSDTLAPRRCTSDTSMMMPRTSSAASMANYRRNATLLMAQRSNAPAVKDLIKSIQKKCDIDATTDVSLIPDRNVPFQECAMISQIAKDAYYRVIIGSADGVKSIVRAMNVFRVRKEVQEAGCMALGSLCERNGSNQLAVKAEGGLEAIIDATKEHSSIIAVQSAACDALKNLTQLLLTLDDVSPVVDVLTHAKGMYLTPAAMENAERLLMVLNTEERPASSSQA